MSDKPVTIEIAIACVDASLDGSQLSTQQLAEAAAMLLCTGVAVLEEGSDDFSTAAWGGLYLVRQSRALVEALHARLQRIKPPAQAEAGV